MHRLALCQTFVLAVLLAPSLSLAFTPQTITVDGTNDFVPGNLFDADGGDTETKNWCTNDPEDESPMDLLNIYLTNDNNFLYFGYGYDRDCFASPQVNLGIAIDTMNTAAGGTTDAFNRKIAWATVPYAPDYYVYDVVDLFNYEVLYRWNGASWVVVQDGSNGLGIIDNTGFQEGKLSLSTLGLAAGDTINIEFWMTQDGTTKGPLDASCSDGVQLSTPGGTTFDTGTAVQMTCMHQYVILTSTDSTPPTADAAKATDFTIDAQKQVVNTTTQIDVQFSEPVGMGATTPGNYAVSNTAFTVSSAVVDGGDASLVHLTLLGVIGPSNNFYNVTVTNVKDLVGNTIVANGTGNVAGFFLKRLRFEGDMSVFMLTNSVPPDTFTVEGSLNPFTFTPEDNALGRDPNVDSVYVTQVPLSINKSKVTGIAETTLEWKWHHHVDGYEPRSNRQHLASSDFGDTDTLLVFWNDDDPSAVTNKAIDVCFQVDANLFNPGPTDTVRIVGDRAPLPDFNAAGTLLKDDGVPPDDTAGDGIYAVYVRFPLGTYKTVNYKFKYNGALECFGQGNRDVYLNDALYDIVGGTNGPINLPPRGIDRCSVTDKAIKVVFRLNTLFYFGEYGPISTVDIEGNTLPLTFVTGTPLLDNGVSPDAVASDDTFSVCVTFPDSSNLNVEYKYLINSNFECTGFPNRTVNLNDVIYDAGANALVLPIAVWDYCSDITAAELPAPRTGIRLAQNYPNPFGARTRVQFSAERPGRATIEVFDVVGRKVKTLLDGAIDAGDHAVHWDGNDDLGRAVTPGVYFYTLGMDAGKVTRRMIYLP